MGREKSKSQHFSLDIGSINTAWHLLRAVYYAEFYTHTLLLSSQTKLRIRYYVYTFSITNSSECIAIS